MRSSMRSLLSAVCVTALLLGSAEAGTGTASVRNAPHGQHGFPFRASSLDLSRFGYVEEEFFVAGTAQSYVPLAPDQPLPENGRWQVRPNVSAPFATRMIVRRPLEPARFNGTVVVEWLNASGADDTQSDWLYLHDELLRGGYAYVGVTTQYVGVQTLLNWESGAGARYAALFHPGDSFAYDMFTQVGAVLSKPRKGDPQPLGSLTGAVRHLLATGFSQSAWWLTTYLNAIHRLNPTYSGFLIDDGGIDEPLSIDNAGNGTPPPPGVPATPFIDTPFPFQLRTDLNAPALVVASEFGLSDFGMYAGRSLHLQPDSRTVRIWEFAGATHLETDWFDDLVADSVRSLPGFALDPCDGPPGIPGLIHGPGVRAALHALTDWAAEGERATPRAAPRLALNVPVPADNFDQAVTFNRDPDTQLALGGIRLPAVAVPIATLNGDRGSFDPRAFGPGGQCYYIGAYDPWNHDQDAWDGVLGLDPSPSPEPDLGALYATRRQYLQRVGAAALSSLAQGYLRPADAEKLAIDALKIKLP